MKNGADGIRRVYDHMRVDADLNYPRRAGRTAPLHPVPATSRLQARAHRAVMHAAPVLYVSVAAAYE